MKLSSVLLCMLAIAAASSADGASSHNHAAAPSPSVDCDSLVLNMASCLTFVSNGSTAAKPEKDCCTGLKTVLNTDAECLCEAFKNSAQFGIVLNNTKAASLPTACKVHAPAASNCGLALSPSGAAPEGSAASPTGTGGENVQAPAPSPGSSGSHGLSTPIGSLLVSIIIALVSTV